MIVAACGALTKALMKALLKVQTWPDWDPLGGLGVDDVTDAGVMKLKQALPKCLIVH